MSVGLDLEDSSSVATAGGSEDQQESTDSASFSIPSLELSDGVTATGNSQDVEDSLSSSFSAVGAQGCALSTGVGDLKDGAALEAAGESSHGLCFRGGLIYSHHSPFRSYLKFKRQNPI